MILNYPTFFKTRPTIKLQDPLQKFLGTFQDGIVEFSYLEITKNAGHSCPDVTGAYLMTLRALKALYKDELPVRGEIEVAFNKDYTDDITSVMADATSHITGATLKLGFRGVEGKFSRIEKLKFNENFEGNIRYKRLDNQKTVIAKYDLGSIPIDPKQDILMSKVLSGKATLSEAIEFEVLWQQRVEKIFNHAADVIKIIEL